MAQQRRVRLSSRGLLLRLAAVLAVLAVMISGACWYMTAMPGASYAGPLPPLTEKEGALAARLRGHVLRLADEIGVRDVEHPEALEAAARYMEEQLGATGLAPTTQVYDADGVACRNLVVERPGQDRPREIVVVGGHYDSFLNPGANDNASGAAATIELARLLAPRAFPRTLRFVAFVNEESPYFQTELMGSLVYAKACRERGEDVVAMLSLETMGYYSDEPGSQSYPQPFDRLYPSTGNFIALVGDVSSRALVRRAVSTFRERARFPAEGGALPGFVPGVGWSDQWAFWQHDYVAIMATDTAPFRYPHYHEATDTARELDYERLARVVAGLQYVVEDLASTADRFD